MASIKTLLNPLPDPGKNSDSDFVPMTGNRLDVRDISPPLQPRKKQKIIKDAAVFNRGPIRGECRYPPYEYKDSTLEAQHRHFEMYPMGEIADYPRHIPYNSEKKAFFEKTGRDSFEVFQYQFKIPGEDNTFTVLWDYNIGLVRTTPLFKCTGHSKTTPAKMLNRNAGLREICYSVTGGALVAQGYWMPYEAAKAIAATFCWSIRYALTPVFGIDFPDLCVHPESDQYGDMIIDPAITKRCALQADLYRQMENPSTRTLTTVSRSVLPETPASRPRTKHWHPAAIRTCDSAYSSDDGDEPNYSPCSTDSGYKNFWTPANTPRSIPHLKEITQDPSMHTAQSGPAKRSSSPAISPKSRPVTDKEYDGGSSDSENSESESPNIDEKAALLLLNLRIQGRRPACVARKRRAST